MRYRALKGERMNTSSRTIVAMWGAVSMLVCTSCIPPAPPASGGAVTDARLGLSEQNESMLTAAARQFMQLQIAESPQQARTSLIESLNADAQIASATLSSDGYMIRIEFSNGEIVALDTSEIPVADTSEAAARMLRSPTSAFSKHVASAKQAGVIGARTITALNDCPDITIPKSKNVKIVHTATYSNGRASVATAYAVEEVFKGLGWTDEEITRIGQDPRDDQQLQLGDLLDHSGYGLVVLIGHGGTWQSTDGQEHYHLQGVPLDEYDPAYGEENWQQWQQWREEGKLGHGATINRDGEVVSEMWLRDDLLREQLTLDENAMVAVLAGNSVNLQDEVTANGAASVVGWNGVPQFDAQDETLLAFLNAMGINDQQRSDEAALAVMQYRGFDTVAGPLDQPATFQLSSPAEGVHLPAWGTIKADAADYPPDTATVKVTISYPSCPEASVSFTMTPGEEVEVNGLQPIDAVVTMIALDAEGNVIGGGSAEMPLKTGRNEFEPQDCEAYLYVALQEVPPPAQTLRLDMAYVDPALPAIAPVISTNLPFGTATRLMPAPLTLTASLTDDQGRNVGTSILAVLPSCADNDIDVCFGWINLQAVTYPPETTEIRVTSSNPSVPETILTDFNALAPLYGFGMLEPVKFTANAYDAQGDFLGTGTTSITIGCGATLAPIQITAYEILLDVVPTQIAADGIERATITATLRSWLPTDQDVPTGPPVAGKTLQFIASRGTLIGEQQVVTGVDGTASIELSSTEPGEITVRAIVAEDFKEAVRKIQVGEEDNYLVSVSPGDLALDVFSGWPLFFNATIEPRPPAGATVEYHWKAHVIGQFGVGVVGHFPEASQFLPIPELDTQQSTVEYDIQPKLWDQKLRIPVRTAVSCNATIKLPNGDVVQTSGGSSDVTISQQGVEVFAEIRQKTELDSEGEISSRVVEAGFFWPKESANQWLLVFLEKSDEPRQYETVWVRTVVPSMGSFLAESDEGSMLLESFAYNRVNYLDDPQVGLDRYDAKVQEFHAVYDEFKARISAYPGGD